MSKMQEWVAEFHEKNDLPRDREFYGLDELSLLRLRLIVEETSELTSAVHENNLIETADALGDLIYVVYGTGVSYGIDLHGKTQLLTPDPPSLINGEIQGALCKIIQSVGDISYAFQTEDLTELEVALNSLVENCVTFGEATCIPVEPVVREIHRSNMTKGPLTEHNKGGKGESYTPPNLKVILWPLMETQSD